MIAGFYGKLTNCGRKIWKAELFFNDIKEPLFCGHYRDYTKKEVEQHFFEQAKEFLLEHKEELTKK